MRLFIAVLLSDEIRSRILEVQDEFRWEQVAGRYSPEENFHITLAFIGEYPDADEVLEILEKVSFEPFTVTVDRVGCFDDLWWAGLQNSPELENVVKAVRHHLADAGIPFDKKKFKAHITFLRNASYGKRKDRPSIHFEPVCMTVEKISLMLSTRGKQGMIYTELGSVFAKDTGKERNGPLYFPNVYFITGTAYAGKSTMVKLLAEKYHGVACEENYHDALLDGLDREEFPGLCYTRDLVDWHDFIRRSPEAYAAWIDSTARECEILELKILSDMNVEDRPVFVDTNICLETLRTIADPRHVLIMLADPDISVRRFFERPDREKQFLYRLIMEEPDPEKAMENYRQGLVKINSREKYDSFLHSGFQVILRDEERSIEETLSLVEKAFGLA